MATGSCVSASLVAPNHYCADQDHPTVRQIAARLPWYTPKYSPHDVPRFYDITGVVRRRRPRRPPCRISSPCVCIPRFACSPFSRGGSHLTPAVYTRTHALHADRGPEDLPGDRGPPGGALRAEQTHIRRRLRCARLHPRRARRARVAGPVPPHQEEGKDARCVALHAPRPSGPSLTHAHAPRTRQHADGAVAGVLARQAFS